MTAMRFPHASLQADVSVSDLRNGLQTPQRCRSESSSALKQINDKDDDSDNEQEMDQTAADMTKEAKKPKHEQDDTYCPQHGIIPFRFSLKSLAIYPDDLFFAKLFRHEFLEFSLIENSRIPFEISLANADHARIVASARHELWKFFGMQDGRENLQTVYDARAGTREICAGVNEINFLR